MLARKTQHFTGWCCVGVPWNYYFCGQSPNKQSVAEGDKQNNDPKCVLKELIFMIFLIFWSVEIEFDSNWAVKNPP